MRSGKYYLHWNHINNYKTSLSHINESHFIKEDGKITMKKSHIIVLVTLVFLIILTGCTNQPINKTEEYKKSLTYSNLVDATSQDEVRKAMESAGISTENIESFF